MPKRFYIIAGEASGDLHASNLILALKKQYPDAILRAWGGEKSEQAGASLAKHYKDLAFMGFLEVLLNIRTIAKNFKFCEQDIADFQPDAVILIDYPGFNLRIAKYVKSLGIPVLYYIAPQLWAWKSSRIKQIKAYVDQLYIILPFEQEFYANHDYQAVFVGHPLLDEIDKLNTIASKNVVPTIAILPGSREQEIKTVLPLQLSIVPHFPNHRIVVSKVKHLPESFYQTLIGDLPVILQEGNTYNLLRESEAALVTSGTATLETALFNVPQVVCYKGGWLSYWIAKQLVGSRIKFISLVNLILDKPAVTELIQGELTPEHLITELKSILPNAPKRDQVLQDYAHLKHILGNSGASERVAHHIKMYLDHETTV